MVMTRRTLVTGLTSLIVATPSIVRASSLMPIRGERLIMDEPLESFLSRRALLYRLDDHNNVVACGGGTEMAALEWAAYFKDDKRFIASDEVGSDVQVSTVFVGIDLGFVPRPMVFETMVFGGRLDQDTDRYATWDEAKRGHNEMVARVKAIETIKLIKGGKP